VIGEPRIRVSAFLHWRGSVLLCRHEKPGKEYWLLPGGGVNSGEPLVDALQRELEEELGINEDVPLEGPVAIVDSIAPPRSLVGKHVVHIIFAGDLTGRSLEAVRSCGSSLPPPRRCRKAFKQPGLPAAPGCGTCRLSSCARYRLGCPLHRHRPSLQAGLGWPTS